MTKTARDPVPDHFRDRFGLLPRYGFLEVNVRALSQMLVGTQTFHDLLGAPKFERVQELENAASITPRETQPDMSGMREPPAKLLRLTRLKYSTFIRRAFPSGGSPTNWASIAGVYPDTSGGLPRHWPVVAVAFAAFRGHSAEAEATFSAPHFFPRGIAGDIEDLHFVDAGQTCRLANLLQAPRQPLEDALGVVVGVVVAGVWHGRSSPEFVEHDLLLGGVQAGVCNGVPGGVDISA